MGAVVAMAVSDLRMLLRDKGAAFFTFVFPLLISIFFGSIFGGMGGSGSMRIAVLDLDRSTTSARFVDDLAADTSLKVERPTTRDEGERLVRGGKASALVVVPEGFGAAADGLFMGRTMKFEAVVDPSRKAEAGLLQGKLTEMAFRRLQSAITDPGRMDAMLDEARRALTTSGFDEQRRGAFDGFFDSLDTLTQELREPDLAGDALKSGADGGGGGGGVAAWSPVEIAVTELGDQGAKPRSSFEISYPQGVVWGLMGCVAGFSMSLAQERSRGTLVRLVSAPISRGQIVAGKALGCFVACVMVQTMLLAVFVGLLGVRVGSWPLMAAAIVGNAVGFAGLMMLLAGLCRTERSAGGAGQGVLIVLAMIGGGTVPLMFLPPWVQAASSISPFKWAVLSTEGAVWRGLGPAEMALPLGVLLIAGVVGYAVGSSTFRRSI